jgi:hypothetical protein
MGTFLSQKPLKIVQYGTHTPSNRIILVAQRLIFQPTLEYLSKISILRSKIGTYCFTSLPSYGKSSANK